jgi:hypothetical protein
MGVKPCEMWMLGYVVHWHETDDSLDTDDIRQWLYDETDHHPEDIDDFCYGRASEYLERKAEEAREKLRRSNPTTIDIGSVEEWIGKGEDRIQFHVRELLGRDVEITRIQVNPTRKVFVSWVEPKGGE